jgi:hypothetical protein
MGRTVLAALRCRGDSNFVQRAFRYVEQPHGARSA